MKKVFFWTLPAAASLFFAPPARAWWPQGHSIIAAAAVESLPAGEIPAWFHDGEAQIAHDAQDPDVQKDRTLAFMNEAEYPQHFFDWEMLQGHPLPPSRTEFTKLCRELKIDPADVGEAPYAVAEATQRLTMIFAEARRYPDNPYIRVKALVQAGILSHYSADLCMPLHVTIDHDGRTLPNGKSPRSGIHSKVDSLIEKLALEPEKLAQNQKIAAFPQLFAAIETEIQASRSQIARTYEIEADLPPEKGAWKPSPAVREFAEERARASTRFTASLFLTAWRDSAPIKLPDWLKRESISSP